MEKEHPIKNIKESEMIIKRDQDMIYNGRKNPLDSHSLFLFYNLKAIFSLLIMDFMIDGVQGRKGVRYK
jgi:hypothetical protein